MLLQHVIQNTMYMDDLDPESGDAMDAILSNAVSMLGMSFLQLLFVTYFLLFGPLFLFFSLSNFTPIVI